MITGAQLVHPADNGNARRHGRGCPGSRERAIDGSSIAAPREGSAWRRPDTPGSRGARLQRAARAWHHCALILAAALAVCHIASAIAQSAPGWNLTSLMAAMRQVRSSKAAFVEHKYFHLLNQPQQSSGQLLYVAPGYLQKTTTEPTLSRLTISGDRLTIEAQGQPNRVISLQDHSEIGPLVDSIRATLAGDLPALTRSFTTSLAGGPGDWTLTLKPRDTKLQDLVASIEIVGDGNAIHAVRTVQPNGDHTDMTVTPASQ